ncbi:MAG: mandelate racemase/muconate lactonizing enzyme family protein [Planctomycetaceae bacterium]|nr:mandelate racemase/muconate lactonizing enzyme family protein [Planctomycetaceae bacterium]
MRVTDVTVYVVEVPQIAPIAPYRSHIRSSSTTQSAIVRIDTDAGLTGWGEHNVNFLPNLSGRRMTADARAFLVGRDPLNLNAFHRDCPLETRLKSGLELALLDICGKAANQPVAQLLGGIIRPRVELAACMGIQSYERAGEIASLYVEQGFTTLKTKAGSDMQEDLDMVRGIHDAVGNKLKLRIDPNRAYTTQQGAELAKRLEPYELEYLEQPIPAEPLAEARWLREQSRTPLALNESVTDPASVLAILQAQAAAFILPDTHIAGGILPCVIIGRICEAAGVPCIMHCGHDLGPKTAAMLHVAGAIAGYSLANDSTYYGLEDDIITERLKIERGTIAVPTRPGLGVEGDPERIKRYLVDC